MRRCAKIDEYLVCSRKLWAPYQQSCGKTLHEKSNLSQMWLTLQGSKETQVINDDNHLIWMFKSKQMQCSYSFSLGSQNWFLPKYWHSLFFGKPIHQSLPNLLHQKKVLLRYYNGLLTYTYFDDSEGQDSLEITDTVDIKKFLFLYNSFQLNLQILVKLFWANFQVQHEKYTW